MNNFSRDEETYRAMEVRLDSVSTGQRLNTLLMYFWPGILVYLLVNVEPVWTRLLGLSGLDPKSLQYLLFVVFTFGWHLGVPLAVLRTKHGMSWREVVGALSLQRPRIGDLLVFLPLVTLGFTLISVPYMKYLFPPLVDAIASIPGLSIPEWSLFKDSGIYDFPWPLLVIMLVGNFVGEEVYFRGYLMKKSTFLGAWNPALSSVLFALYHLWQAPTTWALAIPAVVFGYLMVWRKNLWLCIALHLYLNLAWGGIVGWLGGYLP